VERGEGRTVIAIQGLRKSFPGQKVLDGIDLEVAKGETLGVLGRSGSGKSVLLKLIIGLERPDSGSIRVHDEDITRLAPARLNDVRKKVGFLFQEGALYDSLSIEENVAFPLRQHTKLPSAERRERVQRLLAQVGMDKDSSKLPAQISGGMKKRVGLARALALDPDILLFDEPTAGLDPITASEIEELILTLQKERKIASIVVTHDLHGAKTIADRLALVHDGAIAAQGTFDELRHSGESFVHEFLRDQE
jgi:phospholipid/cholesterol/gamma-HCH transport system ATP-binding protein